MTDIEEVLARVHELDQAATVGPWEFQYRGPQDQNGDYGASLLFGGTGEGLARGLPDPDGELIIEYRTLAPRMAKALQAVLAIHEPVDALHYGPKNSRKVQVCIGCGADDGNWNQWPCPTVRAVQEALRDDHV